MLSFFPRCRPQLFRWLCPHYSSFYASWDASCHWAWIRMSKWTGSSPDACLHVIWTPGTIILNFRSTISTMFMREYILAHLSQRNWWLFHFDRHLDEFQTSGSTCTSSSTQGVHWKVLHFYHPWLTTTLKDCVGGYARVKTILETQRPSKQHSLFLNAGDEFQVK